MSPEAARGVVAVAVSACLLVAGVAAATAVATPMDRNAAFAEKHEQAYEPFDEANFDDALVFIPTPYGEWQNHPFQPLRNDPGFDGDVVYALDRDPGGDFQVIDAYPDRTAYRYAYRGEWTASPNSRVDPKLEPMAVREGTAVDAETTVGVPARVERARVRLTTGGGDAADERVTAAVTDPGDSLAVRWAFEGDGARLVAVDGGETTGGENVDAGTGAVPLDGTDEVVLTVTLVDPDGSTFTYRQETAVRADGDRVEVVWPPERSVCRLVTACGDEGTYLPDDPDAHPDWVVFETRAEADE